MTRRYLLFLLSSSAAWLLSARGRAVSQPAAKVPRIGVLVSASEPHPFADALRHGLQNLGYSEGRNIALDVRYTQGRSDLAAQFAAELVRSDVAMIVAHFTPAVRAAMAATKTIPIVMVAGAPLQSGFIKSLYEPGGNVTGLSAMDAELGGKLRGKVASPLSVADVKRDIAPIRVTQILQPMPQRIGKRVGAPMRRPEHRCGVP